MGITSLFMGTLCSVLFQLAPADMEQSDKQLVDGSQSVITLELVLGSTAIPNEGLAPADVLIPVEVNQHRVRAKIEIEDEGNIHDGYVRYEPAPT